MIATLSISIVIEGAVILAYCLWRRKPLLSILVTSMAANIMTQSLLWVILNVLFRYYLAALLIAEILVWFFESILLSLPQRNQLTFRNAVLLSLCMNLLSFGTGWLLPV